ncbi:MAG: hypothetical protein NTW15_01285 [Burkholderiales bacterium]|nr:hypothetical protein [Burkholderiales bacterium]
MSTGVSSGCTFVQVVAGAAGGSWVEIVRAGGLPQRLAAAPRITRGALDELLSWMRVEDLPTVRGAMQAVRLGAPCRHAMVIIDAGAEGASVARLELSGGEWRAGLWAYVLRVEIDAGRPESAAPADETPVRHDADEALGVIEYEHPSFTLRLDAVARRLHGLPDSAPSEMPVIEWASCFEGEDQIGAISGLCWPVPSELPRHLRLRLGGASHTTHRRLELVVDFGRRPGAVRTVCRALPG